MNIKRILSENLFSAFMALCCVIITESELLRIAGYSAPFAVAITAPVFLIAVFIIYLNRKNSAAYVCAASVFTLILLLFNSLGVSVIKYPADSFAHFFSHAELESGEILLITSILSLILSVLFFPLMYLKPVRLAAGTVNFALLIFFGFNNTVSDPIENFAAAGLLIAVLAELSLAFLYRKEHNKKLNEVLSFLLPLFTAFSIAVAVIPSDKAPISWKLVRNIASGIADTVQNIADEIVLLFNPQLSEFDMGMQGFSDSDGGFAGGLNEGTANQLTIAGTTRLRAAVYLIGSVSDSYTGSGWRKSEYNSFSERDYYLDYCETICAFERAGYSNDDVKRFMARAGLNIEYDDILTKAVFYPLKTVNISMYDVFDARTPTVMLSGKAHEGDKYSLNYLELNYLSEEIKRIASSNFHYDNSIINKHYLDKDIPVGVENLLSERAEYIKSAYTVLPQTVTDRTRELADKITADCNSDYERLCTIEAYLKGYEYTLTPGKVPDGYDAVDYFLFESHKGFCTYFASAMAVLARCEGIPTRYVQGFTVNCASENSIRSCTVTASSAHAWTEAYIEGLGWIPFEPTASRSDSRYGYLGSSLSADYVPYDFQYPDNHTLPVESTEESTEEESNTSLYVNITVFALLGAMIIVFAYIAFKTRSYVKAYQCSTNNEKYIQCYKLIFYLFAKNKLVRDIGETADCFAKRAAEQQCGDVPFTEITAVFDRIRYGNESISLNELEKTESYLKQMFRTAAEKRGKISKITMFIGYCIKQ